MGRQMSDHVHVFESCHVGSVGSRPALPSKRNCVVSMGSDGDLFIALGTNKIPTPGEGST